VPVGAQRPQIIRPGTVLFLRAGAGESQVLAESSPGGFGLIGALLVPLYSLDGIWRTFGQTGATFPAREPVYGPAASYAAADGVLKSMMGQMERTALLFGWPVPGRREEISATIDYMNSEMKRLRP
jgi:hypothetical protein